MPSLDEEIAALTPEQRNLFEANMALRKKAARLAKEFELDEGDVYHQLKQFQRSPVERLRRGLAHGRRRPRLPQRA